MLDDIFAAVDVVDLGAVFLAAAADKLGEGTGNPPELKQVFEDACATIEENPDDTQARFMRGVICQSQRWYEPALADFAVVLRVEPQHARAWLLSSEVLGSLGLHEQAQTARQRALEIDPEVG